MSRRVFQLRRTLKVGTQRIRLKTVKRLEELFDLASGFARGTYKFQYDGDKLPGRTVSAIMEQLQRCSIVQTKPTAIVQSIKPAIQGETPIRGN